MAWATVDNWSNSMVWRLSLVLQLMPYVFLGLWRSLWFRRTLTGSNVGKGLEVANTEHRIRKGQEPISGMEASAGLCSMVTSIIWCPDDLFEAIKVVPAFWPETGSGEGVGPVSAQWDLTKSVLGPLGKTLLLQKSQKKWSLFLLWIFLSLIVYYGLSDRKMDRRP